MSGNKGEFPKNGNNMNKLLSVIKELMTEISDGDGTVFTEITAKLSPRSKLKVNKIVKGLHEELKKYEKIDKVFELLFPDLFQRQANRQWFDALPIEHQDAWLAKMTATKKTTKATTSLTKKEQTEAEKVNNMSPADLKKYMMQKQNEGQQRLKSDKHSLY